MNTRGATLIAGCDCAACECWEIRCTDCGLVAEDYDDETVSDYICHWPTRDDAHENSATLGFEWWNDVPGQPVLCPGCVDARIANRTDCTICQPSKGNQP